MRRWCWLIMGGAVFATSVARAQWPSYDFYQFQVPLSTSSSTDAPSYGNEGAFDVTDGYSYEPVTLDDFDFAVDQDLRQRVSTSFFDAVRRESPDDARRLSELDIFSTMDGALRARGMSTSNLVDVAIVYATEVHQAAARSDVDISEQVLSSLRGQFSVAFADNVGPSSEGERQRLADRMTLQSYLIYGTRAGCMSGELSPCDGFFAAMGEQAAAMFGASAEEVSLTSNGFQLSGGVAGSEATRVVPAAQRPSTGEGRGACGFPVRTEGDRAGQDVLARMSMCDEYQGARE